MAITTRQAAEASKAIPGVFQDLDVVCLAHDVTTPGGVIARGTKGTILQVYGGGVAYMVEFEDGDVPETIPATALESANAKAA